MHCFDGIIYCLGSDINCTDKHNSIVTTLFQCNIENINSSLFINGKNVDQFPFFNELSSGTHWLVDTKGAAYYVKSN